jgi:hypothetical protein
MDHARDGGPYRGHGRAHGLVRGRRADRRLLVDSGDAQSVSPSARCVAGREQACSLCVAAWPVYGHGICVLRQPAQLESRRGVMWLADTLVGEMSLTSLCLPFEHSGRADLSIAVPLAPRGNTPAAI